VLRAAVATLLIGYAVALALTSLHLVAGTPRGLFAVYWPVVLVVAGLAGLPRGLGEAAYGRWVPAAVLVAGLVLLATRLTRLPVDSLGLAALFLWLGVWVALGGRRPGDQTPR
jgi:hypothetical protein